MVKWAFDFEVKIASNKLLRVLILIFDYTRHILNIIIIT